MKKIILNNFGREEEMKIVEEEQQKPIDNQLSLAQLDLTKRLITQSQMAVIML